MADYKSLATQNGRNTCSAFRCYRFSTLDDSGFGKSHSVKSPRPLTTFITLFGRYWFNKLPFGISSAPELFQKCMNTILKGLKGVLCQMDDVNVFGRTMEEHDKRLKLTLKQIEEARATLNQDKSSFGQSRSSSWDASSTKMAYQQTQTKQGQYLK